MDFRNFNHRGAPPWGPRARPGGPWRIIRLALAVVISFGHASAINTVPPPPPVAPPHYFFSIDLDPRYQIVGTGALSEEDAARANCYRFIYKADGKIAQIEYLRAGLPVPDPLFDVPRIDFEYQTGIERRWYHDATGAPVKDIGGVQGEELTLNAAGYPTDITNLDETGARAHDSSGVAHYVRTLDAQNRIIVGRRIGLFGTAITDDNGYFELRTTYDEQGRIMERANFDAAGNPLNDNEGVASVRRSYTIYPDSTQVLFSYFDASGLPVEEKSSGVHQRQRTLDARGFPLDVAYFDATGAPTLDNGTGVHERRYTYDERGNELSEEFLDVDGKLKDQKSPDFARVVYKYDALNREIEKSYFGSDGAPQIPLSLGFAIQRLEYDAHDNITRKQFFDGQGHPTPHATYGVPALRIRIEGDTTFIALRNGKDQPMKNPVGGFYSLSYKTNIDQPMSLTNKYFDRYGQPMSRLRVFVINPHLHALRSTPIMRKSAYFGAGGASLGALLACFLALRKSSYAKRRKVYVPTPMERFLGWFAVFAILEGSLRFFMTIYWAWVDYQNGRMGFGFYVLEAIFILFFCYRFLRMTVTMRVLNIGREDIHRIVRDFFAKAQLQPEWIETRKRYLTPPLEVRLKYFLQKFHAYLAFRRHGPEGRQLAADLAAYIRAQVRGIEAPVRSRAIALYYPCVALCYFLLAGTGFYTLWQMLKGS